MTSDCTSHAGSALRRKMGRNIVFPMPSVFTFLTAIGTAAMCWVGWEIITHGLDALRAPGIYGAILHFADAAGLAIPAAAGFTSWFVTAALNGALGLALGVLKKSSTMTDRTCFRRAVMPDLEQVPSQVAHGRELAAAALVGWHRNFYLDSKT